MKTTTEVPTTTKVKASKKALVLEAQKAIEKKADKKATVIKEVTPTNKATLVESVISNREVKYIYPEDVVDTLSRKSWRQKIRNQLDKLERDMLRIKDQESKEYRRAKKAYLSYQSTVMKIGNAS